MRLPVTTTPDGPLRTAMAAERTPRTVLPVIRAPGDRPVTTMPSLWPTTWLPAITSSPVSVACTPSSRLSRTRVLQPEAAVRDVARARGPGVLGDRGAVEADAVARVADRGDLPQGDRLGAAVGDEPVRAVDFRGRALHDDLGRAAVQQDTRELTAAERRRRDGEPVDVGGEEAVVAVADLGVADGTGRRALLEPGERDAAGPAAPESERARADEAQRERRADVADVGAAVGRHSVGAARFRVPARDRQRLVRRTRQADPTPPADDRGEPRSRAGIRRVMPGASMSRTAPGMTTTDSDEIDGLSGRTAARPALLMRSARP